jgi:hypothetical protein
MEKVWLKEALFAGQTANGFKLGTAMTLGWFWVRISGCAVLYRGASMEAINFENVLAVEPVDAEWIAPANYISHVAGETYFYVVRRVNRCGQIEQTLRASSKVAIDGDGSLALPGPNGVFEVWAEQMDGERIQLVWFYCPIEQKAKPKQFKVCWDEGSGQVDYDNPLGVVEYRGRKFYSFESGRLDEGRYLFAVRAEDAVGRQDGSTACVSIEIDVDESAAIEIVRIEPA